MCLKFNDLFYILYIYFYKEISTMYFAKNKKKRVARNPSNPIGREADDKLKEMRKVQGGCVSFLRQRQKGGVARSFQKLYFFFSSFVLVFCIICI